MGDYIHNAKNEYSSIKFRQKCIVEKSKLRNSGLTLLFPCISLHMTSPE